jgi:4-hydroxybutyrate CoA-transferase
MTEVDEPLLEKARTVLTETEKTIGVNVASLVEDGATLQMGIGSIPDAVLQALNHHRNLGIHSEMFSDGVLDLVEV